MSKPTKLVVNCETGLSETIELTDEEINQRTLDAKKVQAEIEARQAEQKLKEETKMSALSKLTSLGLTEDEAKALIG
jgi:sugar-specific transcriptional regulator TrmB